MTNTYKVTLRDGGTFEIEVTAKSCKEMNNNLKEKLTNIFNENNITNVSLMKTVLSREEKMIEDYESAMNRTLSDRYKELMISVLHWADECYPSDKSIAKYLYEKKGYPISLNGDIPSFEDTMKDLEQYHDYKREQWIKSQKDPWHMTKDGDFPVPDTEESYVSNEVLAFLSSGCWTVTAYNIYRKQWIGEDGEWKDASYVSRWMYIPEFKEN
jgi:hypothetical protein